MELGKWNEINLDMFKYIFDMYWKRKPGTVDKVLELQNLIAIREGCPDVRVYFGAQIKLEDFKDYNQNSIDFINVLRSSLGEEFMKSIISMCINTRGPRITPLGDNKPHRELIMSSCFGEESDSEIAKMIPNPIILWYQKTEDGKYITGDYADKNAPYTKKFVRLRGWKYEDWKEMMNSYCKSGFDVEKLYTFEDIDRSRILYGRKEHRGTSENP